MDAYDIDYKKSMEAFEDLTDTKVYGWEVGYERYDFSYEFKYKDPIYEHPTDYETTRNIQERPALYAFKIATEYFRAHGMVPVFENSHCKLMRL